MNAERWREVRALFDELADADSGVRAARLARLGAADPALRREVEALLESDTDAEQRLARLFVPPGPLRDPLGLSGRTLSHFRVGEPLGSGGMGVVYAAEDTRLGRMVALKVPLPERHPDASGRRRFLQEARSAGAIDHPNVCAIHEVGETADGHLFLAMPLYRGETLRALLEREGALPAARAVAIARQVARGAAAAHAGGIVHRDLKPANVMLLPDGLVKVLDFGLAKAREQGLSATGAMLGTAAYMAPEQIRSEPVDARTDLWALGVVLYEMVTGRKPFRGEHDVSLAHAIVHDEPAPLAAVRGGLPAGLEALILRLLSKDPSGRPASAAEVETRLDAIAAGGPLPASRRPARRLALAAAGAALVLAALAAVLYGRRGAVPAGAVDADLVAVAPFDAADPGLELWREGLVDILSRDLDGAGPLRTVPPSVALRRWEGRVDRPSAEGLGARTGAGSVIFGSVMRRGADSIGIRAALLDRARGVVEPHIEVAGVESRIGELADSLGVRILRVLGRDRAIASIRHTSIGSRSLPALKEFLRGEQFYRLGEWDSALVRFDRAIAEDSTFALAHRRMGWILGSGTRTSWQYRPQLDYMSRAIRFNRGLSPKDSVLLVADSLGLFSRNAPTADALLENLFRGTRSLEDLARRYPDDPSLWHELGERRTHTPPPLGEFAGPALEALDRAIALDSGFAPAYMHTIRLAVQLGDMERARGYVRAYMARGLPSTHTPAMYLMSWIFDSGGLASPAVRRQVDSADAASLHWAATEHLRWSVDSAETAVALLREIAGGGHSVVGASNTTTDTLMQRQQLASALAFRGHLREAARVDAALLADASGSRFSPWADPFLELALFGIVDDSTAHRTYGASLAPAADWGKGGFIAAPPRLLTGAPWWFARGDSVSLARFEARAKAIADTATAPLGVLRARYFGATAGAWLTLLRGDSAGAVRRFEAVPDTLCLFADCQPAKLALATLLVARGDDRRAADILDLWSRPAASGPLAVLASLERGRIAERLGEHSVAATHFRFVMDAWRRPDPHLLPFVQEARLGLGRVAAAMEELR